MDSLRGITLSAGRFFSGTMVSRVTGLVREIAMAACFGVSPAVAAFFMAFRFANLPRRLLGEGAMNGALVPHFEELRATDPERAKAFFRSLMLLVGVSLGGLLLVAELILLFVGGEVAYLTRLVLPACLFACLYGVNVSLLNCQKIYFLPSVAPAAFNVVWIVGAVALAALPATEAMPYLALVVTGALAVQWGVTVPAVWRAIGGKGWRLWSEDLQRLMKPLLLAVAGVAATQLNSALDPIYARIADLKGPAYLWYAIRLQQLPLALFGIALSGAVLPPLARAVERGAMGDYRRFFRFAYKRALQLMIPCTVGIWLLGGAAVELLYGHGRFSSSDVAMTTYCLWAYSLGLVPMTLVMIEAAGFFAHKNTRTPAVASTIAVAANVGLNSLFVLKFGWGSISVALATSMAAWCQWAQLVWARNSQTPSTLMGRGKAI